MDTFDNRDLVPHQNIITDATFGYLQASVVIVSYWIFGDTGPGGLHLCARLRGRWVQLNVTYDEISTADAPTEEPGHPLGDEATGAGSWDAGDAQAMPLTGSGVLPQTTRTLRRRPRGWRIPEKRSRALLSRQRTLRRRGSSSTSTNVELETDASLSKSSSEDEYR